MAEKLGLGSEVRELKLGASFTNPKEIGFHTIRYDFKPASVDVNKMGTLDMGTNSQVTVTVPPSTVFKGNSKPYQKQCIVIINKDTSEITLERLSCNIQVKKTRSENRKITTPAPTIPTMDQFNANQKAKKPGSGSSKGSANHGKSNPGKTGSGGKTKTKPQHLAASLSSVVPKHSPLHASPNRRSPNSTRLSPNRPSNNASLPRIGFEDFPEDAFPVAEPVNNSKYSSFSSNSNKTSSKVSDNRARITRPEPDSLPTITIDKSSHQSEGNNGVGVLSDSSSSSSSSSSSDSSDSSDSEHESAKQPKGHPPAPTGNSMYMQTNLLTQDLQLSESGSESD